MKTEQTVKAGCFTVLSVINDYRLDDRNLILGRVAVFSLTSLSAQSALVSTQFRIQWQPGSFSPVIKRVVCEVANLVSSSNKAQNTWNCICVHQYAFLLQSFIKNSGILLFIRSLHFNNRWTATLLKVTDKKIWKKGEEMTFWNGKSCQLFCWTALSFIKLNTTCVFAVSWEDPQTPQVELGKNYI
jgi:hypothetical protein